MKQNKLNFFAWGVLVVLLLTGWATQSVVAKTSPPPCPRIQMGWMEVTLGPEGNGIGAIEYPCEFDTQPVLVVSPAQNQGSLWALRFEANSLTPEVGSVAVIGEPGQVVTFSWIAGEETE